MTDAKHVQQNNGRAAWGKCTSRIFVILVAVALTSMASEDGGGHDEQIAINATSSTMSTTAFNDGGGTGSSSSKSAFGSASDAGNGNGEAKGDSGGRFTSPSSRHTMKDAVQKKLATTTTKKNLTGNKKMKKVSKNAKLTTHFGQCNFALVDHQAKMAEEKEKKHGNKLLLKAWKQRENNGKLGELRARLIQDDLNKEKDEKVKAILGIGTMSVPGEARFKQESRQKAILQLERSGKKVLELKNKEVKNKEEVKNKTERAPTTGFMDAEHAGRSKASQCIFDPPNNHITIVASASSS